MEPAEVEEARARLEQDYLAGALSADEYMQRRRELHAASTGRVVEPVVGPDAEIRLASWGKRAAAVLIDVMVLIVLLTTISGALAAIPGSSGDLLSIAIYPGTFLYWWLPTGQWGQTLGKKVLGIRVVQASDGRPVGYGRAAARVGLVWVFGALLLPLLLAYLWPLWDRKNQTLYDKAVGTIVVRHP